MHRTITFFDFCDAFRDCGRNESFSYEAKRILFDYFEEYEEQTGESIELDVVALCCEYVEMGWREVVNSYGVDLSGCEEDEEKANTAYNYLNDNTQVCGEFEGPEGTVFVFQQF